MGSIVLLLNLQGAGAFPGEAVCRITGPADLGLTADEVPVSKGTKVAYLLNPALNRRADLEALLRSPRGDLLPPGFHTAPFDDVETAALAAAGRPGDTLAYDVVEEQVGSFFRYMFSQVPWTERSLQRVVEEVNRQEFPLAAVDASPRLLIDANGGGRWMETLVTVRLFMVRLEGDRERNLRWVTRCEMFFEDQAVGRSPCAAGSDVQHALASSVLDAFRGRIAASFSRTPVIRRPSGKIDEPRRDLVERSISEPICAPPAAAASGVAAPVARESGR